MSQFNSAVKLTYLGEVEKTSKNGNKFRLVTLGDQFEMQKHEFFKDDQCDTSGFKSGDLVFATLNLDTVGYNQRLNLLNLEIAK